MTIDWQQLVAALLALAAAGHLVRRCVAALGASGRGGCRGCRLCSRS